MMMGWLSGWRQSIVLAIYGLACRKSSKMPGFHHLATEPVHCSPIYGLAHKILGAFG